MIQLDIIKEAHFDVFIALILIFSSFIILLLIFSCILSTFDDKIIYTSIALITCSILIITISALALSNTKNEYKISKTKLHVENISNVNGVYNINLSNGNNKYRIDNKANKDYLKVYERTFNIKIDNNIKKGDDIILYSEKFEDTRKLVGNEDEFIKLDDFKHEGITLIIEKIK